MPADLVLLNGNILTLNPAQPNAQAIAIEQEKIAFVGSTAAVKTLVGKKTKIIDLDGRAVVPGFIDTHIHLTDYGQVLTWLDLTDLESIKQMQTRLAARVEHTPKGKWILGRGWDENRFVEKRLPTNYDLDAVSPDNPVIFYHRCGQTCLANSKALETAGLTAACTDAGLDKNPQTGDLTGILRGEATSLVWKFIPPPTDEELLEGAALAFQKIVASGITGVCWIAFSAKELAIIEKLAAQNRIPVNVYVIISVDLLDKIAAYPTLNNPKSTAKIGAVMVFADGYLATRTAAMFEPFNDTKNSGTLLYKQEELDATAERIRQANLQLIIHAAGDRAVDAALQTMEKTARAQMRNRLEQAAVLNPQLVERIKNGGVIVSVQPLVINSEFKVYSAAESLGASRLRYLYPLKTLAKAGIRVIGGSDCPMEPLNPLLGMQTAMTRDTIPQERITLKEALSMYTKDAAYAIGAESTRGSIEVKKTADLTVLNCDLQKVEAQKIAEVEVELTFVGGKIVYSQGKA